MGPEGWAARRYVRLSRTWDDTFFEALVRAGAFLFRKLPLSLITTPAFGSCGRPRVGSVPTHRESSANSITVALPSFLAVNFSSLIAWKIRRTENPVLAAASSGVSEMRGSAREPPACSDWISM